MLIGELPERRVFVYVEKVTLLLSYFNFSSFVYIFKFAGEVYLLQVSPQHPLIHQSFKTNG